MAIATAPPSTWDVPRERQEPVQGERWAYGAIGVLVGLLGLIGFANSFEAVQAAAQPSFGPLAWSVPIGIDLGIAAFVALDLAMTRTGMRTRWVRLVPWGLTAATIYLNTTGQHDTVGTVGHAVLPMLWVLAVEVGAHIVRHRYGLGSARPERSRLDRVRVSRWALAPVSTARLRRRMILWEEPSYTSALGRERERVLALCALRDEYGPVAWRWRAPRADRVLFRLGDVPSRLAPPVPDPSPRPAVGTGGDAGASPVPSPVPDLDPVPGPGPSPVPPAEPVPSPPAEPVPSSTRPRAGSSASADALMDAARAIAADLGRPPGRDTLARRLRDRGHSCGTKRAGELAAALRAES